MIEVLEYVDRKNRIPYRDWLNTLDVAARVRIITSTLRIEEGNFSSAKGIGGGLHELRFSFGPGYRVYFGMNGGELVILLGGGSKRRQQGDIEKAHALWGEYKRRKQED